MKVEFTVTIGLVGCRRTRTFTIDDEEVEGMTDEQIERYIADEYYADWLNEIADGSWEIIEPPAAKADSEANR